MAAVQQTFFWRAGSSASVGDSVLREDDGYILREDGGKILREASLAGDRVLREDGFLILREDGGYITREGEAAPAISGADLLDTNDEPLLDTDGEAILAARPRAMWVWDSLTTVLGDTSEENILFNAAQISGIDKLYLYSPEVAFTTRAADFRSFIARANSLGIECWGLDGYRGWFSDTDGPAELYDTIDAMLAYNAASASDERLVGFQIDQEPPDYDTFTTFHNGIASSALSTTPGSGDWQSTEALDREFLMRDWVAQHEECRSRLNAVGYLLSTALPTWFDDYFGEPVTCTYDAVTKNVFLHLSDHTDEIVIMNYNTTPSNQISRIVYEVANSTVPIATGVETVAGVGSGISYGDTSGKQTKGAVLADLATVRAAYLSNPLFNGDAIHSWAGWKALPPASTDDSTP